MVMTLYTTMAEDNELHNLPAVTAVLTSMASGSNTSEADDYTSSDDIMDISSYAPTTFTHTTHQNAIPTSVITPTTSLANGWLSIQNNNMHGGFVPPPVSTSADGQYVTGIQRSAIPTSAIRSVPHHQQRVMMPRERMVTADMDLLRMSPSSSRRRVRDEELQPEEREKRKVRRERNKLAAAKCRQRRVDHTNTLVQETEEWEEKNSSLEQEIQKLQQQKDQLRFILEAHKAMCKKNKETTTCSTSTSTRKTVTLDTPSTEVVTPTSMFKFVGQDTFEHEPMTSESVSSPTCGHEIKRESTSSSNLSSPEASRTLIEL